MIWPLIFFSVIAIDVLLWAKMVKSLAEGAVISGICWGTLAFLFGYPALYSFYILVGVYT